MMVEARRFVDGLKAACVEFFVGVPVRFPCGCCGTNKGDCSPNGINELYQKGGPLAPPHLVLIEKNET